MSQRKFEYGDHVRHPKRPEWGAGSIVKVETVTQHGRTDQRLSVRFANAGLKTLLAGSSGLEPTNGEATGNGLYDDHTLVAAEARGETGWLGEISKKKPDQVMTALPPQASDPFLSLRKRLEFTLDLYRFDASPTNLINWAVAQSGLGDPMNRFNRHELEEFFKRWSHERDQHLLKLVTEASRTDPGLVKSLAAQAPKGVQQALRRLSALR